MATTTKTLTPTNQTITLPDMTERPDASVLVDGIGKDADAINALSDQIANKTTPEALTVVLANNTSTLNRYHAQRIGKMVWFSVNFETSANLPAESALFRIDTSGGTNVVPITQSSTKIIYFSNNEMKFYTLQKSDGKYYVVPASQINANSTVILSGCFVCE
jgi:hypothetical protein